MQGSKRFLRQCLRNQSSGQGKEFAGTTSLSILVSTDPEIRIRRRQPRLTTDVVPANSFTLSAGLVTKALTKKPLGSLHPNSDMLRNLSRIFTWHTLPNPALCRVFIDLTSGVLHFLEITLYDQLPNPGQFRDLGINIRPDISDSAEFSTTPRCPRVALGSRDEILKGGILLRPVTPL